MAHLSEPDLHPHQLEALATRVRLVEACPGAGKTRAMVERYRSLVLSDARGVALISFTNAAVDEVTQRCSETPEALRAPNFVGTIDTFLHRYVVTPFETAQLGRPPRYLQSWNEMHYNAAQLSFGSAYYQKMSIANFAHDSNGSIQLLGSGESNRHFVARSNHQKAAFRAAGGARITKLNKTGLYDSDSARYRALQILRDDASVELRLALGKRFSEVIVDEFQDCAGVEHEILNQLRAIGISVVVVADPDQAIFGFRHSEERLYEDFRDALCDDEIVQFGKNYRSTEAICFLVSSLRYHASAPIESVRDVEGESNPESIYLLSGDDDLVKERFLELAEEWRIPLGQRYSLAHSAKDARQLSSGGEPVLKESVSFSVNLIRELAILSGNGSSELRKKSVSNIAKLFVNSLVWPNAEANESVSRKLELVDKDIKWVRLIIGQLLSVSEQWSDAAKAGSYFRSLLKPHLTELSRPFEGAFSSRVAKPSPEAWVYWLSLSSGATAPGGLAWSTIHASKGREYDAVLLRVPSRQVFDDWANSLPSEDRRLFYVGASRARRLLVLAAPKSRHAQVKRELLAKGIPVIAEKLT